MAVVQYALGGLNLGAGSSSTSTISLLARTLAPYKFSTTTTDFYPTFTGEQGRTAPEPTLGAVTVTDAGSCNNTICSQWLQFGITGACDLSGQYTLTDFPMVCQDGAFPCIPADQNYTLFVQLLDTDICVTSEATLTTGSMYSLSAVPQSSVAIVNETTQIHLTATDMTNIGQTLHSVSLVSIYASVSGCPDVQNKDVTSYGYISPAFDVTNLNGTLYMDMASPDVVCTPTTGNNKEVQLLVTLAFNASYIGNSRRDSSESSQCSTYSVSIPMVVAAGSESERNAVAEQQTATADSPSGAADHQSSSLSLWGALVLSAMAWLF